MSAEKLFDVVGVGLNATDTLILLDRFPAYAGKVPFTREILSPGGQVASAMVCCAKLGLRVKYIGTCGDDGTGVTTGVGSTCGAPPGTGAGAGAPVAPIVNSTHVAS